MYLSCDCEYDDWEPGDIRWYVPEDFIAMPDMKRRKRCVSCKAIIEPYADVLQFKRDKIPETEVERKIHGDWGEIPLAPWYLCGRCGEMFLNLAAIGYECVDPRNTMDALKEYWEMTGFNPAKYREEI